MHNIRYVCLSDLHFGEEDSLLTALGSGPSGIDTSEASLVMQQLVCCLKHLISENDDEAVKPTLILHGDILELALAYTNEAAMVFERFVEQIMSPGDELFAEIIYVPGNHDHHLWETAREAQYVNYVRGKSAGEELESPWHATNLFKRRDVCSDLLTELVRRVTGRQDACVPVAYPNLGLMSDTADRPRCLVITHGHFVEPLYHLVSRVRDRLFPGRRPPVDVWDIETENFAWIDFFWSTLGRSGEPGAGMEAIYERLGDPNDRKKLFRYLANAVPGTSWSRRLLRTVLRPILGWAGSEFLRPEKHQTDGPLSKDARDGLCKYVNGPLRRQVLTERPELPADLTFIFGHTHKPFALEMGFDALPAKVKVYNTGGWVVESRSPEPLHGGAIVLADDELNVVSLRMYNESNGPNGCPVKLEDTACFDDGEHSPFFERLSGLIASEAPLWSEFSAAVPGELKLRADRMADRLSKPLGSG